MNHKSSTLTVILFITFQSLFAGGHKLIGINQRTMGMAGAGVAYAKDAAIAYYNPAGMIFLEKNAVSAGGSYMFYRSAYINTDVMETQEDMLGQTFIPFYAYGKYSINDKIAVGLSINTPFGMGSKWDDAWAGRYISQEYRLKTLFIQPSVCYKIKDYLSIGAGPVFAHSDIYHRKVLPTSDITAEYTSKDIGFGFNVGVYGTIGEFNTYGVTYRSPIQMQYDGSATYTDVPSSLSSIFTNSSYGSALRLPSTFSIAITDMVTDMLYITYEFNYTSWKALDSLNYSFESSALNSNLYKNYKNTKTFRVGADYKFKEYLTLRAGFLYDETPVQDNYLSPEFPDANKLGFSLGAMYVFSEAFNIEASFMYENYAKRTSTNTVSQFSGTYKTLNYVTGIGVNYSF